MNPCQPAGLHRYERSKSSYQDGDRSPFAELEEHLKLDVIDAQRFKSGALAQILVPRQ
jgi:hypothetical protein